MGKKEDYNVTVHMLVDPKGRFHLDASQFPDDLDGDFALVSVRIRIGETLTYPVFLQSAMVYGNYSDYVRLHGCACCSLSTILSAYREEFKYFTPQYTIDNLEREFFPAKVWRSNYSKPLEKQSPLTLKGITDILISNGVPAQYVSHFSRPRAIREIKTHLETGSPVIVETSRIRYQRGLPVSIKDRKFAGSYHTAVLIGIEADGDTVWMADSANRVWAGKMQRLKRVSLKELINYMFPNLGVTPPPPYYKNRTTAGGYILVGGADQW